MKSLLTCPFGLSSLLSKEIKKLAFPILETKATAVTVETDKKGIYQLNLQSRIANKVYIILGETTVTTFDELFDFITSLPRKEYLFSGNLSVQVVTKTSQLSAERSIQSVAHKAIINALPADKRSPISPVDVFLYLENNHLKVCLNTSGPSLHQRGYKLHT
jgi:23S rRNA G2445 N2-methylase RlmL